MTDAIYMRVFDTIKAEKREKQVGNPEKVTIGHCIGMMMGASDQKTRLEAGLTAIAFLERIPDDPVLTPETKLAIKKGIAEQIIDF